MSTPVTFRPAVRSDLPQIVRLLADDVLGASREDVHDLAAYEPAFAAITADANQLLVVADLGGRVVGTLQLTFIAGLSRRGASRAQIEAVRVARDLRGQGIGAAMVRWACDRARERGCRMAQLTSTKTRTDAHRFYERLGFEATHVGMKMPL